MEDEANRLYLEAADKNMIDKDEFPQTAAIESGAADGRRPVERARPGTCDRHLDDRLVRAPCWRAASSAGCSIAPAGAGKAREPAQPR